MIPSKTELRRICREWVIGQLQQSHYWDAVFDGLELPDEEIEAFFDSDLPDEIEHEISKEIVAAIKQLQLVDDRSIHKE